MRSDTVHGRAGLRRGVAGGVGDRVGRRGGLRRASTTATRSKACAPSPTRSGGDPAIVSGETGATGLAALLAARELPALRELLGLDADSRVLLLGSEGDTDPEIYREITGRTADGGARHERRPRCASIDGDRLLARLDALAQIGAIDGGGCCRLALTDDDRRGRDLVVRWMRELGLAVQVDAIGNVFGCRAGPRDAAPVMTGSHIDTVRTGGRYDGNLGVLAGLEVVQTLNDAGVTTDRPLVVAVFTDEEGARFAPDMLGSLVYVGGMPLAEALDVRGDRRRRGWATNSQRIGYAGDGADRRAPAARLRRAAHRAGAGARRRRA